MLELGHEELAFYCEAVWFYLMHGVSHPAVPLDETPPADDQDIRPADVLQRVHGVELFVVAHLAHAAHALPHDVEHRPEIRISYVGEVEVREELFHVGALYASPRAPLVASLACDVLE